MGEIKESKNKLTVIVDENYFRIVVANPMDDFFIGAINYLVYKGKSRRIL